MKKAMALGMAVLITSAAVISCDNPSSDYPGSEKQHLAEDVPPGLDTRLSPAEGGLPGFEVQYFGGGYVINGYEYGDFPRSPVITVASSRTEFEQSFGKYEDGWFADSTAKYTDDFFADNFLVITSFSASSGSFRYRVEKIDADGNINISILKPEVHTCDMAAWTVIIPLSGDSKLEKYNIVFNDVRMPPPPSYDLNIQYVRTDYGFYYDYFPRAQFPHITVISSPLELSQYYISMTQILIQFPDDFTLAKGFSDSIAKYTDDFFAQNVLVIVLLEESSGGTRHNVEKIDRDGNIYISRVLGMTADMAAWNIIIPQSKESELENYKVAFLRTYP